MSKIRTIEIRHHEIKLNPPFKASWDGRERHQFLATIVKIIDDEGRIGIGSGDLMLGFEGHEELFIGQDPLDIGRHYQVLSHLNFHYGRPWPFDLALWDLNGKIHEKPVWQLAGGTSPKVRLYASSGVARDISAMKDQVARYIAEGFPALKIRFSSTEGGRSDWREDVRVLETIRANFSDKIALMVDCNQGWRMPWDTRRAWNLNEALEVARALEPLDIFWMEEPLHRSDIEGMKALRDQTSIKIAGGEMNREVETFTHIINAHALDIIQPDVALVGGITGCLEVAKRAHEAGIILTPHSWTNGIGVLANAHLCAAIGNVPWLEFPYDPPEWSIERRDFPMRSPLKATNGWLILSDAPGLGLELREGY